MTAILTTDGTAVVEYAYDAWGVILTTGGTQADTLGELNSLRYRGYVYDEETGYYYLQSRYYNPGLGRFLNADAYASTGQGLIGNNMFAYYNNSPVLFADASGTMMMIDIIYGGGEGYPHVPSNSSLSRPATARKRGLVSTFANDIMKDFSNLNIFNSSEQKVLDSNYFSAYRGVPVFRFKGDRSFSFGALFITYETNDRNNPQDVVRHEYGHVFQMLQLGHIGYLLHIGIPSITHPGGDNYYAAPWEITADIFGGVQSRTHTPEDIVAGFKYLYRHILEPYMC